jgi:Skp family chaperone for outer membrane proteins
MKSEYPMNERVSIAGLLVLLMAAPLASAQAPRSGGGDSQRIMQQYQQVAAEKTALQAQLAQVKKDLDGANAELAAVKKERDALKNRSAGTRAAGAQLAQATAAKESAEKSLEQNKQKTAELIDRFKLTIGTLKGVESEKAQLQKDNAALTSSFDKCAANNVELFDISNAVLDRYEHVGFFTKTTAAEPFTRLTRTRIDNLVDEYRERAQELRLKKAPSTGAAQPPS